MSAPAVPDPPRLPSTGEAAVQTSLPPQWTSVALLGGGREALIDHHGALYRLRLTASGKLILTK